MAKFGIKNILIRYLKSAPSDLHDWKILQKNKNIYIWNQKYLYLSIFELEFEKTIAIFEISTLESI